MDSRSIRGLWSPGVYFDDSMADDLSTRTATIRAQVEELGTRLHDLANACGPPRHPAGRDVMVRLIASLRNDS